MVQGAAEPHERSRSRLGAMPEGEPEGRASGAPPLRHDHPTGGTIPVGSAPPRRANAKTPGRRRAIHVGRLFGGAALLFLALLLPPAPGEARSLRAIDGPANYPPSGFKGRQFIDNRGCIFVRAGFGNKVVWVPRVDRGGRLLCGYKPTFAPGTSPLVRKAPRKPQPAAKTPPPRAMPVPRKAEAASPPRVERRRKPAGRVRLVCPAGWELRADGKCHRLPRAAEAKKAMPLATGRRAKTPPPRAMPVPRKAEAASPPRAERRRKPAGRVRLVCQGGWELRADGKCHYLPIGTLPRKPVLGGDDSSSLAPPRTTRAANAAPAGAQPLARLFRKAPPRRSLRQPNGAYAVSLPDGYRPEIPLDRFNPWRAVGTAAGDAAMARIWTDDLPRRLRPELRHQPAVTLSSRSAPAAPPKKGRRIAAGREPALTTSAGAENPPLPPYATPAAPADPVRLALALALDGQLDGQAVRNDAGPAVTLPAPTPMRIQLAIFADPGKAEKARARFAALGFPARIRRFNRGGRAFAAVILGPFASEAEIAPALARARSEGFADALPLR